MSKDSNVVPFAGAGGAISNLADLGGALSNVGAMGSAMSGIPFIKMDKATGDWIYGQSNTDVQEGSLWAVNPATIMIGLICWGDARNVLGEVMVPAGQPMPNANDQVDHGFSWDAQFQFDMTCMTGEDKDQTCRFKTTALGGKRAVTQLAGEIGARASAGLPAVVPVIELLHESYEHKSYGQIHNPIFRKEHWMTMEGEVEGAETEVIKHDTAEAQNVDAEPPKTSRRKRRPAA